MPQIMKPDPAEACRGQALFKMAVFEIVSVRQQKRDGRWYVWIRHAGERAAKRYDSEEEAIDVAKAVRQAILLARTG